MSTSAILWMTFFLTVVWGGTVALVLLALRKDRQSKP